MVAVVPGSAAALAAQVNELGRRVDILINAGITDDPVLTKALDAQIPLGLKLKAIAHLAHPTALKTLLSELR